MTPEQINALDLSQLRAAVAEVMRPNLFVIYSQRNDAYYREGAHGYADFDTAWRVTEEEGRKYQLYADSRPGDSAYHERVVLKPAPTPAYESDHNAALTLVDKLAEDGTPVVMTRIGKLWSCVVYASKAIDSDELANEPAETLPIAICRAFLLTQRIDHPNEPA